MASYCSDDSFWAAGLKLPSGTQVRIGATTAEVVNGRDLAWSGQVHFTELLARATAGDLDGATLVLDTPDGGVELPVDEDSFAAGHDLEALAASLVQLRSFAGIDAAATVAAQQLFALQTCNPTGESADRSRSRLELLAHELPHGYLKALRNAYPPRFEAQLAAIAGPVPLGRGVERERMRERGDRLDLGAREAIFDVEMPDELLRRCERRDVELGEFLAKGPSNREVFEFSLALAAQAAHDRDAVPVSGAEALLDRLTPAQWLTLYHVERDRPVVNTTPHDVTIRDEQGRATRVIPPSGLIARARQSDEEVGALSLTVHDGSTVSIPLRRTTYAEPYVVRSLERVTGDAVATIGADLHAQWVAQRREQVTAEAISQGRDPATLTEADFARLKDDGAGGQVDIFHTPFDQLPDKWREENLAAARVAVEVEGLFDHEAASRIHDAWLERNRWSDDSLKVPYGELSQAEQDKDLAQVHAAREVLATLRSQELSLELDSDNYYLTSYILAKNLVEHALGLDTSAVLLTHGATFTGAVKPDGTMGEQQNGCRSFAGCPEPLPSRSTSQPFAPPAGVQVVNTLGRDLDFYDTDQTFLGTIPASETVAQANETCDVVGEALGVPIHAVQLGAVTGLPAPREGVMYVVNSKVLAAALADNPGRTDLLLTSGFVRNLNNNQVTGATGLAVP
jgi:hypothetical protein